MVKSTYIPGSSKNGSEYSKDKIFDKESSSSSYMKKSGSTWGKDSDFNDVSLS